jgi:hypothetical protein
MESGLHEIDHYRDDFLFADADKTSNMLSFFAYLLRLKNIIALAPFHQEFELTSFQCQLKVVFILRVNGHV